MALWGIGGRLEHSTEILGLRTYFKNIFPFLTLELGTPRRKTTRFRPGIFECFQTCIKPSSIRGSKALLVFKSNCLTEDKNERKIFDTHKI